MWVVAIKSEGKPTLYLTRYDLGRNVFECIDGTPYKPEEFYSLKHARKVCEAFAADLTRPRQAGDKRSLFYLVHDRSGRRWTQLRGTPKVYRRAKKGLVAAAGSLQVAGRLLGEIKTQDVQLAQLAGAVKQIRLAVVKMLPKNLRRAARSGKRACVTPNGRTDGHGQYVRRVNGAMVCEFCREPVAQANAS